MLNKLIVERRVNAIAQSLGIEHRAVSNALVRLRCRLADELVLRTPKAMPPAHTRFMLARTDIGKIHVLPPSMAGVNMEPAACTGVLIHSVKVRKLQASAYAELPGQLRAGSR